MGKKAVKNRYGVQVGDIFNWNRNREGTDSYDFYQVVALRGETQVAVRKISQEIIAFDGNNSEGVVPVRDAWISDEILVRKVDTYGSDGKNDNRIYIKMAAYLGGNAYLEREKMYVKDLGAGPGFPYYFYEYNRELAKQLDFKKGGSGIYTIDKPFKSFFDDRRVVIRYPDGREEETSLKEVLHSDEIRRQWERDSSPEMVRKRKKAAEEWLKAQEESN